MNNAIVRSIRTGVQLATDGQSEIEYGGELQSTWDCLPAPITTVLERHHALPDPPFLGCSGDPTKINGTVRRYVWAVGQCSDSTYKLVRARCDLADGSWQVGIRATVLSGIRRLEWSNLDHRPAATGSDTDAGEPGDNWGHLVSALPAQMRAALAGESSWRAATAWRVASGRQVVIAVAQLTSGAVVALRARRVGATWEGRALRGDVGGPALSGRSAPTLRA